MLKKTGLPRVNPTSLQERKNHDNSLTISHNIQQTKRLNGLTSITPVMISTEEIEKLDSNYYDQNEYPDGYGNLVQEEESALQKEERRAMMRFKALRFYKMNNKRAFKSKVNNNFENMYAQNRQGIRTENRNSGAFYRDENSYINNSDIKMSDNDELNRNFNNDKRNLHVGPNGDVNHIFSPRGVNS